jgi:hypothetical protein
MKKQPLMVKTMNMWNRMLLAIVINRETDRRAIQWSC